MSEGKAAYTKADSRGLEERSEAFLGRFTGGERERAREMLEPGRVSYRMRDNDNLRLARSETQLARAVGEGKRRLESRGIGPVLLDSEQVAPALRDPGYVPAVRHVETDAAEPVELQGNPTSCPGRC